MTTPGLEFSRIVDVSALPPRGHAIEVTASAEERTAVAARLGVRTIDSLSGALTLTPIAGGAVRVSGEFAAAVGQVCVVTLEPISSTLTGPVAVTFVPAAAPGDEDDDLDPDSEDTEIIHGSDVDIGEVVVQHLALAIDPYPRKAGASYAPDTQPAPKTSTVSPFAALAKLRSSNHSR